MFQDQFQKIWCAPAFSSILSSRRELALIAGVGVLHVGFSLAGVTLWTCPIRAATGIPCPGCGLTRASLEVLRGDFSASVQTHAFAPLVLTVLLTMLAALLLPAKWRDVLIGTVRTLEMRFGFTAWALTLIFIYWAIRLLGYIPFPNNF